MKRALALAALVAAAPAAANDSMAETAAGGLVLTRSADIDLVSEDLFVSVPMVRVGYVFRNRSNAPIRATIAFPMPDRDFARERFSPVAFPSGFTTRVDGKPVAMRVERKAVRGGRDVTALLAGLHVPAGGDGIGAALDRLPADAKARLVELGIAFADDYDAGHGWEHHLIPAWTVKETFYWPQTFPVGRPLRVEHRYRPGAGVTLQTMFGGGDVRKTEEGRQAIARYCIDSDFLAAAARKVRDHRRSDEAGTIREIRIGYVLTTGANWRGPIGSFRMVIDKGDPANLVSFCARGVRKISPTRFEVRHSAWRPDRDVDILILETVRQDRSVRVQKPRV